MYNPEERGGFLLKGLHWEGRRGTRGATQQCHVFALLILYYTIDLVDE